MSHKQIVFAPNICLPRKNVNMNKYAVIACDQFTSQKEYWDHIKELVGNDVSTFNMIYPEAYLECTNQIDYINKINDNINRYLENKDIIDAGKCFILVERLTSYGVKRLGLVISIDLEEYSYIKGVDCSIKSSESTIVERIPPRLKIRKEAPIELPHTLLLFDDKDKTIVEPLYKNRDKLECAYDFDLNQNGGHIRGYIIRDTDEVIKLFNNLYKKNNNGLLFVVGDGNHSLATAKAHWDNVKQSLNEEERKTHPARFALVEANNIYDDGIIFEPIHRLIFNPSNDFESGLENATSRYGGNIFAYSKKDGKKVIRSPKNAAETYKVVQDYLDSYLKEHQESKIDFIHDESSLIDVCNKNEGSIAIIMPTIKKDEFFEFVANDNMLPRKSFSMGHASEKRYYLEGKKII